MPPAGSISKRADEIARQGLRIGGVVPEALEAIGLAIPACDAAAPRREPQIAIAIFCE